MGVVFIVVAVVVASVVGRGWSLAAVVTRGGARSGAPLQVVETRSAELREGVYTCSGAGSSVATDLVARVPGLSSWTDWYDAPHFLKNGHVHTIFAAKLRRTRGAAYRRELIRTADGGTLALDLLCDEEGAEEGETRFVLSRGRRRGAGGQKFLLLSSGLGGGSQDGYVRAMANAARDRGWRVGVLNMRSCGGSPVTSPRFFSAHRGATDDFRAAVAWIDTELGPVSIAAIGWSNSGSITVNALAEQELLAPSAGAPRIHAACALATPLNMPSCSANLERPFHKLVYDRSIGGSLAKKFRAHRSVFEKNDAGPVPRWEPVGGTFSPDTARAAAATSIRAIDEALTAPCFGFDSVDAYYADASCDNRLAAVRAPLLILNAADDPIAPLFPASSAKVVDALRSNPSICLALTDHGGHLGWADAKKPTAEPEWVQGVALDFLDAAIDTPL